MNLSVPLQQQSNLCEYCYRPEVIDQNRELLQTSVTLNPCAHKVHQKCALTLLASNNKTCPEARCGQPVNSYRMRVFCKDGVHNLVTVDCNSNDTIYLIKQKFNTLIGENITPESIAMLRMIYEGRLLSDALSLRDYNICHLSTINCVLRRCM